VSGWPLVLRHADVKRVANHNASLLVLTGSIRLGMCELQDALIVRRNERYRKDGRFDLQQDPAIRTIAITKIDQLRLMDVDLGIIRAAGFKTQRDFYDDWLQRRSFIDPELEVRVCRFSMAEPVRLLHRRAHRGYTSDPRLAAQGEPEALSREDLSKLSNAATQRYEREHAREVARRRAASIRARRRDAERRGEWRMAIKLTEQLADLEKAARAA
jgi:hypothetical protein